MRRTPRLLLPIIGLAVGPALAQPPAPSPASASSEPRNAALRYWTIWGTVPPEMLQAAADVDWASFGAELDPAKLPALFREGSPACIPELVEASRLTQCDFGIEREKGIEALLPHLPQMRASARLLRVDARRQLAAGHADAAATRLASIYRMASQLSHDDVLISTLVSVAIAAHAGPEVEVLAASGRLTASGRDEILEAIRAFPEGDPFRHQQALAGEDRLIADWILANFRGEKAGQELIARIGEMLTPDPAEARNKIAALDETGLRAEVDRLRSAYAEARAAWNAPDGEERVAGIQARVGEGEYGSLAQLLFAYVTNVRASAVKSAADLARIRDTLSKATLATPSR